MKLGKSIFNSDSKEMQEVQDLIKSRNFKKALEKLEQRPKDLHYYRFTGLIYFLKEEYATSLEYLRQASSMDVGHVHWEELSQQAEQNSYSKINEFVPEVRHFTNDILNKLYRSETRIRWPGHKKIQKKYSLIRRLNFHLGNLLGFVFSILLDIITELWGRLVGYRDKIWTNWYRRPVFLGVLSLAFMRNQLNRKNLFSTYSKEEKERYKNLLGDFPKGALYFRTINGTFNNLENPIEGAAGTRFQRNVDIPSSDNTAALDLMEPNPRLLSRTLLSRKNGMKEAPFVNMLIPAWIQFQNHDWISHGEPMIKEHLEVEIDEDDPMRRKYHQTKMFVGKTPMDPTRTGSTPYKYTFINEVTHWWDGSQIYGSDHATAQKLRSFHAGKLKVTPDGLLPLDEHGIEITGFTRNWWIGLSLFHNLFVLEHNAICDHLATFYPDWEDERLYHVSRLINSALMAKIHTIEWNSAINPNKMIYNGNHSNWYGFLTTLLRKKEKWRTVAHLNIRNTELGGVVGNPIERYNADFGLTQEFVEAYRIHSMLPEKLKIKSLSQKKDVEELPFVKSRQTGSTKCIQKYGITDLWYSLGNQHPGQVVLNNYPKFMQELSIPGNPVYDMGTVDILRSRERGMPRYNEFRRQMGLTPVPKFEDLTSDEEVVLKLKDLYGHGPKDIERLDFMIGILAEEYRPDGFAFGETMFQLFMLNATRRLQADRFYTDCYTPEYYTEEGMKWIDTNSLKSVLLRHYPSLAETGLSNVMNAFEPWDETKELDPARHPLRAYDKELKKNPWIGDAYKG